MRATGTFSVQDFTPTELAPTPGTPTAVPVGVATMAKQFEGEVTGRAATLFTAAYDAETGSGGIEIEAGGTHRIWFDYEIG
ncbi:DUF3224 domain-containing protein [Streptomyces sp. NBC_01465]|uniref:DUF3224 domain-containing protein n=1 Tax=Streptomyces sp. NBC_01465 TaxID=2903878 RepID=UPI002E345C77|nr:DUF3224 domain-containing protein [Streptomyces sp. NBC_01465]